MHDGLVFETAAVQLAACNTLGANARKLRIYGLYATQEPQLYA